LQPNRLNNGTMCRVKLGMADPGGRDESTSAAHKLLANSSTVIAPAKKNRVTDIRVLSAQESKTDR
jgi:hypothetical protein